MLEFILLFRIPAKGQPTNSRCDPSLRLSKMEHMPPKGRLQEFNSPQAKRILELRKSAISLLIACLTDETQTKESIEDYWPVTTVGDIAFFFLCALFTDSSWKHSTITGVINWETLQREYSHEPSSNAWYRCLEKHGRKHVQDVWYKRWKEEEHAISWDAKEQCFRIDPKAPEK